MFHVHVFVCLLGRDGELALSRWLALPFAPFPGLLLHGITSDPDLPESIESAGWDVASDTFEIQLVDCVAPRENLADLIDHYGPEWERHEPEPEPREPCNGRCSTRGLGWPALRLHTAPGQSALRAI